MKSKILLFILFSFVYLNADKINYPLKKDFTIDEISKKETWKRLLYIENGNSKVNNKDYFISKSNKFDIKQELINTINNYKIINKKDFNLSSRCKFPARYYWLSNFVRFPNYKLIDERCEHLSKYKSIKKTESISLILVSGYLGNPASTFGHSFVKLNENEKDDLFDTSVNYGALVPENENIIKYIFKGIFGGYESGFSDKYFYTQDLVYNHTEFRDMWEYKLNLNEEQKKFLILHLWEILGKKFDYYFLDKNCGYKVSQLVELVTNQKIIDSKKPWYPPVETFYKLEELNKSNDIIESIKYIPSYQQIVYKKYENLKDEERKIVKRLIQSNLENINLIDILEESKQINIINFLVDYIKYLEIKNKNDIKFEKIKNKILLKRLSLPVSKSEKLTIKDRLSPSSNNKPIVFSLGNNNYENLKSYRTISFSPFSIETLGENNFGFSSLTVLNTTLAFNSEKKFLENLELIDISKINRLNSDLENDYGLSWKLNLGLGKINRESKLQNTAYINADIGKSKFLNDDLLVFSMLKSTIYSKDSEINVLPYLGFNYSLTKSLKSTFEIGYSINNKNSNKYINSEIQYNYNKKYALSLQYKDEEYSNFKINFKWFFR